MNKISCSRWVALVVMFAAAFGATACGESGCGGAEEEVAAKAEPIVCGSGTHLQGGQCVATQGVTTR